MKRLLFFLLALPCMLFSQYYEAYHFGVKDGLPSSCVYQICEDDKGFIWLGTEAGLVRYDGTYFKNFTTYDGLPDNEVLSLNFNYKDKRLWVVTYCKTPCYYAAGKLYTPGNDKRLLEITCRVGEYINGNTEGDSIEFLYNGLDLFESAGGTLKKILPEGEGLSAAILQVKKWDKERYDVLTDSGLVRLSDGRAKYIYPYHTGYFLHGERCRWFGNLLVRYGHFQVQGRERKYYISHLEFYEGNKNREYILKKQFDLGEKRWISEVSLVKDHYLLTEWGKALYTLDTGYKRPMELIWEGNVNSSFTDRYGNIWVATQDNGVYLLKRRQGINFDSRMGIRNDNITALTIDCGRVFLGNSEGELFELIRDSLIKRNLKFPFKLEKIRALQVAGDTLFAITNSQILLCNLRNNLVTNLTTQSGGPKTMLKLHGKEEIIVGLIGTTYTYNLSTGKGAERQTFKRVLSMAQHPDGRIFFGSLDGLYAYQDGLPQAIGGKDPLIHSRVTSLSVSPDSILWIGTPSNGVIAFNGKRVVGHLSSTKSMSYSGAICRKLISVLPGELWVATNDGINHILYHKLKDSVAIDNITPINTGDGLLSEDVNDIALFDDHLYAATAHGLSVLNYKSLTLHPWPPVYITSIRINNIDSDIHEQPYSLSYFQNNIRIAYIGIQVPSGGNIRYQYRLLNNGKEKWETTFNTSIELHSLAPGSYTFELTALDKFGNRSNRVVRASFIILPAYYQTWWFAFLLFALALGTGYFLIRLWFKSRQRIFEREQDLKKQLLEMEQQALKAQMNPHFIFNCLTAIQHFVNTKDNYAANIYLSSFARLIRKTLDFSGEQFISLEKELAYLENYIQLESMRFQDKFRFLITVDEQIDIYHTMVPPMLVQPLVENAIRHGLRHKEGNGGLLKISFEAIGDRVKCCVDDNGIGIEKSMQIKSDMHVEYQSRGMDLTESRIAAINALTGAIMDMEVQNKYDNSGNASGTRVVLYFKQQKM